MLLSENRELRYKNRKLKKKQKVGILKTKS